MKRYLMLVSCLITLSGYSQNRISIKSLFDSLQIVLEEMHIKDQRIRVLLDSIGYDALDSKQLVHEMLKTDSINQRTVSIMIEKYGWLGQSLIGVRAFELPKPYSL